MFVRKRSGSLYRMASPQFEESGRRAAVIFRHQDCDEHDIAAVRIAHTFRGKAKHARSGAAVADFADRARPWMRPPDVLNLQHGGETANKHTTCRLLRTLCARHFLSHSRASDAFACEAHAWQPRLMGTIPCRENARVVRAGHCRRVATVALRLHEKGVGTVAKTIIIANALDVSDATL